LTGTQDVPCLPEPGPGGQPQVSVRGVTMRFPVPKRYREILMHPFRPRSVCTAVREASLEIERGDRVAVMGPNGAGKTTLLKLIGGLLLPTEGEIIVSGVNTEQHNSAARKSVGFVLNEERSFFWRLSGAQNLEFFGALDGLWGNNLRDRIHELIVLVGLEKAGDKPISAYSSGMKQRLAIARGLIADPDVLILDEPTRALDPVACDDMTELILSRIYNGSGKTLLIATHRVEEATKLCNKVLIIDEGRVKAFDRIGELCARGLTLAQHYRQNAMAAKA